MNFQFNSANRVICSLSLFSPCVFKCMVSMAVPQNSNFARKKKFWRQNCMENNRDQICSMCMFWAYERIRTQWGFMMWTNIKIVGYFSKVYHWKYAFIFSNYMIARARSQMFSLTAYCLCTGTYSQPVRLLCTYQLHNVALELRSGFFVCFSLFLGGFCNVNAHVHSHCVQIHIN